MSQLQALKKIIETQLSVPEQKETLYFIRNVLRMIDGNSGTEVIYIEDEKDTLINFNQFKKEEIERIIEFIQTLKKK